VTALLARNLPVLAVSPRAIAGMFVAIFDDEFGDAGFVELAEAFGNCQSPAAANCSFPYP